MGLDNPLHIAFLLVILLLVFGAKRLPEMGRSLGEGLRGFKDSISGEHLSTHTLASSHESQQAPRAAPQDATTGAPAGATRSPQD